MAGATGAAVRARRSTTGVSFAGWLQTVFLTVVPVVAPLPAGQVAAAAGGVETLLRSRCSDCHFDGASEGGVRLDDIGRMDGPGRETAIAAWRNIRAGTMPPAGEPQPTAAERRDLLQRLERDIFGIDATRPDPGRTVLRRLNRVEYAATVRDLTGLDINLVDDLPADDTGYGFDTIGAVLTLSPLLLEKYMALATQVAERVVAEAEAPDATAQPLPRLFPLGLPPADPAAQPLHLRRTLEILASRGFRRPVDAATIDRLIAVASQPEAQAPSFPRAVAAALTAILVSPRFLFHLHEAETEADAVDAAHRSPSEYTAVERLDDYSLASRLAFFLWSSMPDDELFALAAAGNLRRELGPQVSRMIRDPKADALAANFVGQWLRTRDVEAVPVSLKRVLGRGDVKEEQEAFDTRIRPAMRRETEMLFLHLLRNGGRATDLLVTRSTFLNAELADFSGIEGVAGAEMRLVDLPPSSGRGGLLSHGSFLVVTSTPTRTSPVKRGVFVLESLLGAPPPPAPPDIPGIEAATAAAERGESMQNIMARHRADPACASCHARMDPIGFALEEYDAIGRIRSTHAVAGATGRLQTGESFTGARGLAEVIATERRRDFHRCLTEKLLTYALGRGVEIEDSPTVEAVIERLQEDGRLETLVQEIVASVTFQMQRRQSSPGPSDARTARR